MKTLIITALLAASLSDTIYVVQGVEINTKLEREKLNSYCEGFKEGYADGFCYEEVGCIAPIPPICPVRRPNESNNYKGGYARGFKKGLEESSLQ